MSSNDKTIVYGMMVAMVVAILVVFSACTSGTGPAYQGPGIEVDVDHRKTPKTQNKKPGSGFFGGSSSRSTRRK